MLHSRRAKLAAALPAALIVAALAVAAPRLFLPARGAGAPAWTHWWCSAAALHARTSGFGHATGVSATIAALLPHLPHLPHLLPLALLPGTLLYLRHAAVRHRVAQQGIAPPSPA
jgi:hypothetical protein